MKQILFLIFLSSTALYPMYNDDEKYPLDCVAVSKNNFAAVDLLLSYMADPNIESNDGQNVKPYRCTNNKEIINRLKIAEHLQKCCYTSKAPSTWKMVWDGNISKWLENPTQCVVCFDNF